LTYGNEASRDPAETPADAVREATFVITMLR
jgi:hypothetical protein